MHLQTKYSNFTGIFGGHLNKFNFKLARKQYCNNTPQWHLFREVGNSLENVDSYLDFGLSLKMKVATYTKIPL